MFGPTPLRDIFLVAGFELKEMLRSRRAYFVIGLYLLVAAFMSYLFVQILVRVETMIPNQNVPAREARPFGGLFGGRRSPPASGSASATSAGTATTNPEVAPAAATTVGPTQNGLFGPRSPFRAVLRGSVDEQATMDFIASQSPIALCYTLASFLFTPILIMLTASESIAQEQQSRGVRFVALRTGRLEYALGKMFGQWVLLALVTLLSGAMCMAVAAWKLQDFEFGPALSGILLFWPRVVAFGLPFVGLAAFCSMNSSSTASSRAISMASLAGLWMIHGLASEYAQTAYAKFFNALDMLVPYSYQDNLWHPAYSEVGHSMLMLAALGALYLAVGLAFYRRRDL